MTATPQRLNAILIILIENENDKRTHAGLKRIQVSAKFLGLDDSAIVELEKFFEYRDKTGNYYPFAKERKEKK